MLFIENSYLKEFEAKIININSNEILLNQTAFYAKSGGQPGDTGTLSINEKNINIIEDEISKVDIKNNQIQR